VVDQRRAYDTSRSNHSPGGVRNRPYIHKPMSLELGDPLAHRALQALLRAEATVRKRVAAELSREGVSPAGFSVLVVLTTAGGSAELKTLRRRLGWSKANATEVTATLRERGLVRRRRDHGDRRLVVVDLTSSGRELVERLFPEHSDRVTRAFGALDETEKRSLAELCRKLAA
jgi:MarR family 2-MHQ and catechol resistance regulon transcriptional repressor